IIVRMIFWHYRGRARGVVSPQIMELHAKHPSSHPRRLNAPRLLARDAGGARVGARPRGPAHRRPGRRPCPTPTHYLAHRTDRESPPLGRRLGGTLGRGTAAAGPLGPARGDWDAWRIHRAVLRRILSDRERSLPRGRLVPRHWGLRRDDSPRVVR